MQKAIGRKKEVDRLAEGDWYGQSTGRGLLLTACCLLLTAYCLLVSLCLCVSVADIT